MDRKPRILLLTDWFEPGYKAGGPIQSCINLVLFLERDFDIYIYTSDRDFGEKRPYADLPINCWVDRGRARIFYADMEFQNLKTIRAIIKEVNPKVIYTNSMFSTKFTFLPLWIYLRNASSSRFIIAPRGMLNSGAIGQKRFKKAMFLKLFGILNIPSKIVFHATDKIEALNIRKFFPKALEIKVAENIPSVYSGNVVQKTKSPGELKLLSISRLHPHKNIEFIIGILTKARFKGKIDYTIFGDSESEDYLNYCNKLSKTGSGNIHISFRSSIPHQEIFQTILSGHFFILPTLGENFGHAIFEALTCGRPVLISDQTPWRNLQEHKAGWDIPLSDMEGFIKAIEEMLAMGQEEFDQYCRGAKAYADHFVQTANFEAKYKALFG